MNAAALVLAAAMALAPKPWLGMFIRSLPTPEGRVYHVVSVTPGGPAARAGIVPGDIVTAIDGTRTSFGDDLDFLLFLGEKKPGRRMRVRLVRAARVREAILIVGRMPPEAAATWEKALALARRNREAARHP